MKRSYPTDLSDAEWECLESHVPAPSKRGRPKTHSTREILDAIFYILKSGCPWRLLPREFPPWETVYWWFGRWRTDGTVEGQCPADTTFFAAMGIPATDGQTEGFNIQLTDPDGDGVYTGGMEFEQGQEVGASIFRGIGTQERTSGTLPEADRQLIQNFGPLTLEEDTTLTASFSCATEGSGLENNRPEESGREIGLKALPATGGINAIFLGAGALLVAAWRRARSSDNTGCA